MAARKKQILLCTASISALLSIFIYYYYYYNNGSSTSFVSPLLPSFKPVFIHLLYRLRDIFAFLAFTAAIAIAIFTTQKKSVKEEALDKTSLYSVTPFHHLSSIFGDIPEEAKEEDESSNFMLEEKQQIPVKTPKIGFYDGIGKREITRSRDDSASNTSSTKLLHRKVSLHRKTNSFDECLNSDPSSNEAWFESRQAHINTKVSIDASQPFTRNSVVNDVTEVLLDKGGCSSPSMTKKSVHIVGKNEDETIECKADVSSPGATMNSILNVTDEDWQNGSDDSFAIRSRTRMSSFDVKDADQKVGSDGDFSPPLARTNPNFNVQNDEDQMEYEETLLTSPNEINRQADAFIARINEQIRLQKLASIERNRKRIA